ncbi:MAG TPA: cupin domain-containing protein [Methylophaga aminisulfidivorans]|uniref:Cupin domain-containing protein n=3 Tax=root TaxID=1 RepID=A0A7C1ZVB6_9GAMM|nr:cupin domain-containing protein [Methylophaga aminisulfidivorans]
MSTVTKMIDKSVSPIETDLDGWVKHAGNPTMKTWIEYKSADERTLSGCWEATPGTYHATYAAWEFVHIISGKAIVTPEGGEPITLTAGEAMLFEKDFIGTWEIQETVLKHFVLNL